MKVGEQVPDCVFCDYQGPNTPLAVGNGVYLVEPLNPVTQGHLLAIPLVHVTDAMDDWVLAGKVLSFAALHARRRHVGPCNFITSVGREATQTIDHLHIHVVPRREGDGLMLPWSENRDSSGEDTSG